ncbi:MAG: OmpA family protein [Acidobacteriia bacterium]|nr:OmpA family protein [Terriglobia bacterium]
MKSTLRSAATLWLRKLVAVPLLSFAVAMTGQARSSRPLEDYTLKLRPAPGLMIVCPVYGGHYPDGTLIGDYDWRVTVNSVSAGGLDFNWSMTYPARASGHRIVRAEDLRQSHKVSVYYPSGENGPRVGYSDILRVSDAIFADLKAGRKTAFEFDGNENPVTAQKTGEEYLSVLVNERPVRVRTLKGKTANGWSVWILDNPDFPMILRADAPWRWIVTSFSYPEASGKNLVDQLKQQGVATTHAVLFAFNSAELSAESRPILNALADYLKANPGVTIQVEGHTDNIGGAQFNLDLSRNRAESVKKYLVEQGGVKAERLRTAGFGLTLPVAANTTPEGRALNRRVVFREPRAESSPRR